MRWRRSAAPLPSVGTNVVDNHRLKLTRAAVYALMEGGRQGYFWAKIFDAGIFLLISFAVGVVVIDSLPDLPMRYDLLLRDIELGIMAMFSIEYLLRLWVCVENPAYRGQSALTARLRFIISPFALIDICVLLPFYASAVINFDPEVIAVLRILRVFKLFRSTGAFEPIARVFYNERRSLFAVATLIVSILFVVSTLEYMAERQAQPDKFSSIPAALYWGIVTLTTVGYGDIVPVTALGKLVAGATVLLGLLSFALPSAIIVSGFIEELKRRDLAVTWNLVAGVPLFQRFSIAQIARVAALLKLQRIEAGETIVKKGDPGDAMYFIATGEVDIVLPNGNKKLSEGEFFGEMSLIEHMPRSATIIARTACDLLTLDTQSFNELSKEFPDIEDKVRQTIGERQALNNQKSSAPKEGD